MLTLLVSAAALLLAAPFQLLGLASIEPRTISSPSGEWTAHLDPSSRTGGGPSHVVVSHGVQLEWTADLPITLWDAVLTDTGQLAGYAFTAGNPEYAKGDIVIAIFAPDGHELQHEAEARRPSPHPDFPANPWPKGLFVQPVLDRLVVRVPDENLNRRDETWWTYELSTGRSLGRIHPKALLGSPAGLTSSMDARAIAGTPLTLVQWYQLGPHWPSSIEPGTRFVLVDADGKNVWTLEYARDYDSSDMMVADRLREEAWKVSGILATGARRFELRHVATNERVAFEIVPEPQESGGWVVREVSRTPWVEPKIERAEALPLLQLRAVATIPFDAVRPPTGAVHDVLAFDFDADGHIRLVRGERNAPTADLLRLGLDGEVLEEAIFQDPTAGAPGIRGWTALSRNRWFFSLSPFGEGGFSRAWIVDAASGGAQEIAGFSGPTIGATCPTADGGLVVFGGYSHDSTGDESLMVLDAEGRRRWEIRQRGYTGAPSDLMNCEGIAVDASGAILVLDDVRHAVLVFSSAGEYQRTVKLPPLSGDKHMYAAALFVLKSGDWLVHDSSEHAWHRLSPQGDDRGGFIERREDGGLQAGSEARIDAAGTLWGTDGIQLFALDADGVAHTRLGVSPVAEQLDEPSWLRVDELGRVAVTDRRTHAVHLFDGTGRKTMVLRPDPTDFEQGLISLEPMFADSHGRAAILLDAFKGRYLVFGADGRRGGIADLGGECLAFVPGSSDRWVASRWLGPNVQLRRLTAEGRELLKLERRADRSFFTDVQALGCAHDGSVWVLSGTHCERSSADLVLDLFSPTGEPQRSISLSSAPPGYWDQIAVTPRWLLVSSHQETALLVSTVDGTVSRVRCDGVTGAGCAWGFSLDGLELWCVLPGPLRLQRFALPE